MNNLFSEEEIGKVKDELGRILNSAQFSNAPIVRAFFEFVVNEALSGRGTRIKAYTIATDALGRSAHFDPSSDTLVRTTAGRVRYALQAYNRERGEHGGVVISLPKGGYVPSFQFLSGPISSPAVANVDIPLIESSHITPRNVVAVCLFAVATMVVAFFLWRQFATSPSVDVVIDVRPVRFADQDGEPLARAIDMRLAPALTRIGLADILPPTQFVGDSKRTLTYAPNDVVFTLETSIAGEQRHELLWQLTDADSGLLVWASKERLKATDPASIDQTVQNVAFRLLGDRGALPLTLARYHAQTFSGQTCLFRAQILEAIESDITYPKIRDCLERMVTISPNNGLAWAVLSSFYANRSYFYAAGNRNERTELVAHAERAAEKAAEFAPGAYLTKVALMHLSLRQRKIVEFDAIQKELRKNYPGDVYLQIRIATRIARLRRGREALEMFDKLHKDFGVNLRNWSPGVAVAYFAEGEYEQAYHELSWSTSNLRFVHVLKAAILGKLKRQEEAAAAVSELIATNPDIKETFFSWLSEIGWERPLVDEIADGLAKAGLIVIDTDASGNIVHVGEKRPFN
ncbi:hypothetical protein HWD97_21045 [Ochrobactrum sp. C6C9]|uniref:tetratricopeptide repeat protein n=1 Tax=Ochrobactrum sp. C6C9 TaxID=2736662 RepID=UPI0035301EC3|nr:hypothetical protein [Ochrobactrum sp. C6C9]